ncbi:uncharacterized protein LOC121875056 [Homarus americanus]|uniref:uncharacterized protein LOC121875056 n=1 Tax=Homarus americanus TaxID=6706 RepID=UPI001C43ACBE|nr:uncharacterized protein LOC121875056 [Homarus americanus]
MSENTSILKYSDREIPVFNFICPLPTSRVKRQVRVGREENESPSSRSNDAKSKKSQTLNRKLKVKDDNVNAKRRNRSKVNTKKSGMRKSKLNSKKSDMRKSKLNSKKSDMRKSKLNSKKSELRKLKNKTKLTSKKNNFNKTDNKRQNNGDKKLKKGNSEINQHKKDDKKQKEISMKTKKVKKVKKNSVAKKMKGTSIERPETRSKDLKKQGIEEHKEESSSSQRTVLASSYGNKKGLYDISDLCNSKYQLDDPDDLFYFGSPDPQSNLKKCKFTVKAPTGVYGNLFVDCLNFNLNKKGCKMESLQLKEKGRKRNKKKYCSNKFDNAFLAEKEVKVIYTRIPYQRKTCSGGFFCYVGFIEKTPEYGKQEGKSESIVAPLPKQIYAPDPFAHDICGEVWLKPGETLVFASSNNAWKASCSIKFNAPENWVLTLSCPHFSLSKLGCKTESLKYTEIVAGKKIKGKHCERDAPQYTSQTNMLLLKYRRKELLKTRCSQGFVCQVTVESGLDPRPLCPSCGVGKVTPPNRIVSGEDADQGEYPWLVQIYITDIGNFCGGSLISSHWIMTAAHCFFRNGTIGGTSIEVALGELMLDPPKTFGISEIVIHEDFDINTLTNDITLIKLVDPVTFTPNIAPICLATEEDIMPGENNAIVVGWGLQGCGLPQASTLKEVSVDLITDDVCKDFYESKPQPIPILPTHICSSDRDEGDTPLLGDSGGPMMQQLPDGRWVAVGIVSFGSICDFGEPVVYTRVPAFIPWITKTIGKAKCY